PEALSAIILKKLKADAERALNDTIECAVITVPAYFTDAERTATKQAAFMADIPVLDIINEPTAAALAYSINHPNSDREQVVLVYDLGGGTFDVALVRYSNQKFKVLYNNGNHLLGGFDFDKAIVRLVTDALDEKGIDIKDDPDAIQQLMLQAENAKKALSQKRKTTVTVYICGKPVKVDVTREDFEDEIEPELTNTISTVQEVLDYVQEEYGIGIGQLDKILLVGGSTRIPMVSAMIEEEIGIKPSCDIHPDEAVAIGAAFYAEKLAKEAGVKPETGEDTPPPHNGGNTTKPGTRENPPKNEWFTDCTAHSIGIIITDAYTGEEINQIILPKGSPVPTHHTEHFETVVDYQECIRIQITQGEERDIRYVRIIGSSDLMIRPKPRGTDIAVTISCDESALVHVFVMDADDNIELGEMNVERQNNLNQEEVKQQTNMVRSINIGGCDD
ncbi:MAG: Hsp70 family protein, partial [Oscillospiraceae bacterium]|nr:Hsp70 family protein [Oscillospiraceae bacterium]